MTVRCEPTFLAWCFRNYVFHLQSQRATAALSSSFHKLRVTTLKKKKKIAFSWTRKEGSRRLKGRDLFNCFYCYSHFKLPAWVTRDLACGAQLKFDKQRQQLALSVVSEDKIWNMWSHHLESLWLLYRDIKFSWENFQPTTW